MVNDIRNYGYILQVALLMAMALSLGIAALAEKQFTKWVGWFGAVLGGAGIVLVALRARRDRHGLDDLVGRPRRPAAARVDRRRGGRADPDGLSRVPRDEPPCLP